MLTFPSHSIYLTFTSSITFLLLLTTIYTTYSVEYPTISTWSHNTLHTRNCMIMCNMPSNITYMLMDLQECILSLLLNILLIIFSDIFCTRVLHCIILIMIVIIIIIIIIVKCHTSMFFSILAHCFHGGRKRVRTDHICSSYSVTLTILMETLLPMPAIVSMMNELRPYSKLVEEYPIQHMFSSSSISQSMPSIHPSLDSRVTTGSLPTSMS